MKIYIEETWVEIDDYPNYMVSDRGQILNIQTDRILRPREARDGSLRVALSDEGRIREFYIHHIVAKAFYGRIDPGEHVIHINGDKKDNTPQNLRIRKKIREIPLRSRPEVEGQLDDGRRWGRRVQIVETKEVFRTVRDCARYIQGDYASIYKCLTGSRRSHRGFTFEYYDW